MILVHKSYGLKQNKSACLLQRHFGFRCENKTNDSLCENGADTTLRFKFLLFIIREN